MSAFLAYSNERRKTIAMANPSMGNAEISKCLSALWKEAPEELKERYRQEERQQRERFKVKIAEWKRRLSSDSSSEEDDSRVSSPSTKGKSTWPAFPSGTTPLRSTPRTVDASSTWLSTTPLRLCDIPSQSSTAPLAPIHHSSQEWSHKSTWTLPPAPARACERNYVTESSMSMFMENHHISSESQDNGMFSALSDHHEAFPVLEPFIDTDIGGFLAAFAALEQGSHEPSPRQSLPFDSS